MSAETAELDDPGIKRAKLVNATLEALASAVLVVIYAKILMSDDVKYKIRKAFAQWKASLFGPPPMSEEQFKEAARQTVVEAMRVVRNES